MTSRPAGRWPARACLQSGLSLPRLKADTGEHDARVIDPSTTSIGSLGFTLDDEHAAREFLPVQVVKRFGDTHPWFPRRRLQAVRGVDMAVIVQRRAWFLGICEACRMYASCTAATSVGPILCSDDFDQFVDDWADESEDA